MTKRKILVLDAYTNGHEAALVFIRKMGWRRSECELVFCGSHEELLRRLVEGKAYAVVPMRNSIAGEVMVKSVPHGKVDGQCSMEQAIDYLERMGYDLKIEQSLSLAVTHNLLAKAGMVLSDVRSVYSHTKALEQCRGSLKKLGIKSSHRITCNSTAEAAKMVARSPEKGLAAIGTERAAKAYNLQVLARGIEDSADNITEFLLLYYAAWVEPVVVGIIGVEGGFGKAYEFFFKSLGCEVIGSDPRRKNGLSNEQVIKASQVIVFAPDLQVTVKVIKDVIVKTLPGQLVLDVASVKAPAIRAMLKGKAEVVGLHPMYAPSIPSEGQTLVVLPARLECDRWKHWLASVYSSMGVRVVYSEPDGKQHDQCMQVIQTGPQLSTLLNALLSEHMEVPTDECLELASPFYRTTFALIGRLLQQSPKLYAGIAIENPDTAKMLKKRILAEMTLLEIVQSRDYAGFERFFERARKSFGTPAIKSAEELFRAQVAMMQTHYSRNRVTIEFDLADSKPGLLKRVLGVFDRRKVNILGIDSASSSRKLQFKLSFEQDVGSEQVRFALEELESWNSPRATVVL